MKNNKSLIALLLASGLMLTGCKPGSCSHVDKDNDHLCDKCQEKISDCVDENNDHKCDVCGEGLPYVESVEIEGAVDELGVGSSVTLSAKVTAPNGGSTEVEWSTSSSTISLKDNGDGTATVTGVSVGAASVSVKSKSDASVSDSVSFEVKNWDESDLGMMQYYLGGHVPYFSGAFEWTDSYFAKYGCLTAESENETDLELALEGLAAAGIEMEYDKSEGLFYGEMAVPGALGLTFTYNAYVDNYDYAVVDVYGDYEAVPCESWPANYIAEYTPKGIETVLPAAEGSEFSFKVGSVQSVYFYSIYVKGDMEAYLDVLDKASFAVAYDDYYDCYTAKTSDLLVDVYESDIEGEFVISSYTYAPWPGEELDEATAGMFGEVKEIPSFSALNFGVYDYSMYGLILLNSLDSEPIAGYIARLESLEWVVSNNDGVYEAVAPTQEYAMTVEFDTDYNGISLSIYPHSPVAVEWPTEFVNEQIELLGAEGTVPAYSSENVEGYSTSEAMFGYGPLIIISVTEGTLDSEVLAYAEQLRDAGYFVVGDNYGAPVYAQEGTTLGISPYAAYDGTAFYIELLKLDEPAVQPPLGPQGDLEDFPVNQIEDAFGSDFAALVPLAEGSSFSFAEDGVGGYNITVYGGDHDAYVGLLATSSLIHDEVPASASHVAYDSFYTSDFCSGIDVYPADTDGTYVINLWNFSF